jgi:putative ABC transport system permease protein
MADEIEEIETIFDAFRIISFVFGGLALLAGIIGIMNIMLITIRERTAELGIRRALGATPRTIIIQIMAETLFLTVLAGLAGAIIGVAAIEGIDGLLKSMPDNGSFKNPEIALQTVIQALVTMTIMGALAGILPAWRAVSVRPVDAIRSD